MQAILLKEIEGLGEAGTVVNVARGYMRNYLQPRGLAEVATPAGSPRCSGARSSAGSPRRAPRSRPASWSTCSGGPSSR